MHTYLLNKQEITVPNCEVEKVLQLVFLKRTKPMRAQQVYDIWLTKSRDDDTRRRRVLVGTYLGFHHSELKEVKFQCVLCVT